MTSNCARFAIALAVMATALMGASVAPSSASAAFQQRFDCQIKSAVPSGFEPAGVAVDEAGQLWVSEPKVNELGPGTLDEFNSSCEFLGPRGTPQEPLPLQLAGSVSEALGSTTHESLAIDYLGDKFFLSGNSTKKASPPFVEVFDSNGNLQAWNEDEFGGPTYVAVDHSTESASDPSACGAFPLALSECTVYVAHGQADPGSPAGRGLAGGIEKFGTSGAPANFEGCSGCSSYVKGDEITGTPSGGSFQFDRPTSMVVDSFGRIFVINGEEVDEYQPSGEFVRRFVGEKTPGLGGSHEGGGYGGTLRGVAIDPTSGLLAVSISRSVFEEPAKDEGAVDEFDPSSGKFLNQITTSEVETGPGVHEARRLRDAEQMTFDSQGALYVVDGVEGAIDVYDPGRFVPAFRDADVSERTTESATLNDWVNPESSSDPQAAGLTECYFQYVTEARFESEGFANPITMPCTPAAGVIPADDAYHEVHAEITGLESGDTYYYRVAASIGGTLGGIGFNEPAAFTAPHAPRVDSSSATNRSSTFADLDATIDPLGADTSYHFEYVGEADYNATEYEDAIVTAETDIGAGGSTGSVDARVAQQIGGLAPGTTYHFRVVAENKVGHEVEITDGPDSSFTTLPAVGTVLPDARAYELLTPPGKGGAADMFVYPESNGEFVNRDVGYPSESGDGYLLETDSAFGPFPAALSNRYVFNRDSATKKWTYTSLASPSLGVQRITTPVFDPSDFSQVGFGDAVGSEVGATGSHLVDLVGPPGGPYTTVFTGTEASTALGSATDTREVGGSSDLKKVVLESLNYTLAPEAEGQDAGSHALYEWDGTGACESGTANCQLVDVTAEGSAFKCGATLGQGPYPGSKHNAVSADGSKVIFTAPDPFMRSNGKSATSGCWDGGTSNTPQLYMRSDGETLKLSAPEPGVTEKGKSPIPHPAVYAGASEDGSKIFFVTETELTENAEELGPQDPELYLYDTATSKLTRVSAGESGKVAAHVFTVPTVSADGSAVYFTAFGALVAGLQTLGPQQVYLYRYDIQSGATTYIATIDQQDYPNAATEVWWTGTSLPKEIALAPEANWYTTPDGRYLVFATASELKHGYSTAGSCTLPGQQGVGNGHCDEIYRYHYEPGASPGSSLTCVSCNLSGESPVSNAEFARSAPNGLAAGSVRAISDNGSRVFFDSADSLVPQASNGTLNVYEWELDGSGSCASVSGCVSLISSGEDSVPSFFLGSDPEGRNVFFGTHAELVPEDTDTNGDLYDARVCTTEEPCFKPPLEKTAQCEGDACQNAAPAPIAETPVSWTFSGGGNVPPPVKPVSVTRSQLLAGAMAVCKRKRKRKRASCEAQAKRRYGVTVKAKRSVSAQHRKRSKRSKGAKR